MLSTRRFASFGVEALVFSGGEHEFSPSHGWRVAPSFRAGLFMNLLGPWQKEAGFTQRPRSPDTEDTERSPRTSLCPLRFDGSTIPMVKGSVNSVWNAFDLALCSVAS